ncbi:hypothetical protein ACFVWF_32575 [Rhodococcus qingshengii]|uniref:hypothetical protein n=1 Tax=Rhodococcus qingshengii TaxID=334542 RepID=UPI0036D8E4A4
MLRVDSFGRSSARADLITNVQRSKGAGHHAPDGPHGPGSRVVKDAWRFPRENTDSYLAFIAARGCHLSLIEEGMARTGESDAIDLD